ncbi:hypothetical protein [Escherichia albertii]|uniref:hypothetical protein n=2 Tax=Escherichia albertii TaxID=208962 RepID=UPI00223A7901|nr:hypothetical protein [Escherichia albertii]MCB2257061.1 hypothetical protein [Escherichia albertii]
MTVVWLESIGIAHTEVGSGSGVNRNTNNMMKLQLDYLLIAALPLMVSCSGSMHYIPNELPSAKLGTMYDEKVNISGGLIFILAYTIQPSSAGIYDTEKYILLPYPRKEYTFTVKNDGISVKCAGETDDWSHMCETIEIKGKINSKQNITVRLEGSTYGTSSPGIKIDKTFTIHIED